MRKKLLFVTTFSREDFENYGKNFVENWNRYSKDIPIYIVLDEPRKNEGHVLYTTFLRDYYDFLKKYENNDRYRGFRGGKYDYRYDLVRFCHKAFALDAAIRKYDPEIVVWWDSDIELTREISSKEFLSLTGFNPAFDIIFLGRKHIGNHPENGFFLVNRKKNPNFLEDFKKCYTEFEHIEKYFVGGWTDCHILEALIEQYRNMKDNFNAYNMSSNIMDNHVWPHTKLGLFSIHHKGFDRKLSRNIVPAKLKEIEERIGTMQRYQQLYKLIETFGFKIITEIGVARGDRAVAMVETALSRATPDSAVIYFGYDLFEDMTPEIAEAEFNKKTVSSLEEVRNRLLEIQKNHPNFFFHLYKGNTREILPKTVNEYIEIGSIHGSVVRARPADSHFVFVDGGHSVETIRNDISFFLHVPLLVVDDYYEPDENRRMPDISRFGCNNLISMIPNAKIMPIADPVSGGGRVRMVIGGQLAARIEFGPPPPNTQPAPYPHSPANSPVPGVPPYPQPSHPVPPPQNQQQEKRGSSFQIQTADGKVINVETRNAVPNDEIKMHVHYTCRMMKRYNIPEVPLCKPHDKWAVMVGGSPSYRKPKFLEKIREFSKLEDHYLFVSKTAHDFLIYEQNIIPYACILLDPRPHVRMKFRYHPDVLYIVASQCHPSVIDYLLDNNARMMVYHALVGAGEDVVVLDQFPYATMISRGTTSQTRGAFALTLMGFCRFKFFGMDSCYLERPSDPEKIHGINKHKPILETKVKIIPLMEELGPYLVDPELMAQVQDFDLLFQLNPNLEVEIYGEGLLPDKFNMEWGPKKRMEFDGSYERILKWWEEMRPAHEKAAEKRMMKKMENYKQGKQ